MSQDKPTTNPFESIEMTFATGTFDTNYHRMAWIYHVIMGIDDECVEECRRKFQWSHDEIRRLRLLHKEYAEARAMYEAARDKYGN